MPFAQDFLRPYARLATTNRLMLYGAISTLAVSLVILNAFKSYSNFYSVAVHLSRSNRSVMVLANFGILGALIVGRGFQHLLFGSLRATEVERLYDRIWFFLTESLLAFTIFRDEFDVSFAVMFGFLLFVKCFHWLMGFRIELMDQIQYPGPNLWFHVRMNILFFFLWFIDTVMLCFAIENILTHGIGGVVLFASEYAILMAGALNSMCKYFIIFYDIRRAAARGGENAPPWEDKSMFIFYIDLATDFLKLVTYLTVFLLVLTFYGLPLNIVRDVYMTARSFINRCRDLVRYRTATRNMDERYPNATEGELNQMSDRTCIICREEMLFRTPVIQPAAERTQSGVNDTPKKLPCGHVFHFHCLRSWLERQQSCPTCRRTVLETRPPRQNPAGQNQPQMAPAPQHEALPQRQGFGGPAGGQPPAPGFLARWLGGAGGAPPIVPGQFAPGPGGFHPAAPNQAQFQQQGLPGQNPLGHWQQPGYFVPIQQPQGPVQVLQGFFIGNQWQPWFGAAQHLPVLQIRPQWQAPVQGPAAQAPTHAPAVQAPAPAQTPSHAPVQAPSHAPVQAPVHAPAQPLAQGPTVLIPSQTTHPSPTPTVHAVADVADSDFRNRRPPVTPSTSSQNGSTSTLEPPEPNPSPREAARLAALRRMGSQSTVPSSSHVSTPSITMSNSANIHQAEGATPGRPSFPTTTPQVSPAPSTSASASGGTPSSATAGSSSPSATVNTNATSRPTRPLIPSLIPLFEPAPPTAPVVALPTYQSMPPQGQHPSYPYVNPQSVNQQRVRILADSLLADLLRNTSNPPDLRSLPQTLTQEQLDRLDGLTREAIDERLRVLQNVQDTLWRCGEALLRVKSVLPAPRRSEASSSQAQQPSPNSEGNSESVGDTPNSQGKTRATTYARSSPSLSDSVPSSLTSEAEAESEAVLDTSSHFPLEVEAQSAGNDASTIIPEVLEGVVEPAEPAQ